MLRTSIESQLCNLGRFRIFDRTNLADVLSIQQLNAALSDPKEALALGKLTPAHVFVVGTVKAQGEGAELQMKVIETMSEVVMTAITMGIADLLEPASLMAACADAAEQLASAFPRV